MTEYKPIYSDYGRISLRVPQVNTSTREQILTYQQQLDAKINNTLRSVLGKYDANGFYINLPLYGTFDVIDIIKMQIQLAMDFEIQLAADDCVIAYFRLDTAENRKRVDDAMTDLKNVIYTKFGGAISIDQDFTTDYLASWKVETSRGIPIALSDGSGVLLLSKSVPPNRIGINPSNPDNRVIVVPGPPL